MSVVHPKLNARVAKSYKIDLALVTAYREGNRLRFTFSDGSATAAIKETLECWNPVTEYASRQVTNLFNRTTRVGSTYPSQTLRAELSAI